MYKSSKLKQSTETALLLAMMAIHMSSITQSALNKWEVQVQQQRSGPTGALSVPA